MQINIKPQNDDDDNGGRKEKKEKYIYKYTENNQLCMSNIEGKNRKSRLLTNILY